MKKLIVIAFCFISFKSFSQIHFGIDAGTYSASMNQTGEAPLSDYGLSASSYKKRLYIGAITEFPLGKKVFIQPSFLYFMNGSLFTGMSSLPGFNSSYASTLKLHYLKLPVNIIYKFPLSKKVNGFTGAGLYVAKGIEGKEKGTQVIADSFSIIDNKVDFNNNRASSPAYTTYAKPWDFGFNVVAGVQWNCFQLYANFSDGLMTVYSKDGYNYKNMTFGVSLAYLFSL